MAESTRFCRKKKKKLPLDSAPKCATILLYMGIHQSTVQSVPLKEIDMPIKNIFSLPWSRKGFSMVGVLVAGGMMGGLALFLAEMTKQQHVAGKVAETGVEITALHSRVVSLLADGEACKKTLEGTPVNPAPTITGFKNRKGRDVLAVPSAPFNRLVKLRDAKLTNIQGTGTTREVEVELTFEKLSKAISGQKTVTRLIPLTLELDTANTITSCHSPQNYVMKEQLCKEMGGTWNGSNKKCSVPDCSTGQALTKTSTGFACVSPLNNKKCANDQIFKGFNSNGVAICKAGCPSGEALRGFDSSTGDAVCINTSGGWFHLFQPRPRGRMTANCIRPIVNRQPGNFRVIAAWTRNTTKHNGRTTEKLIQQQQKNVVGLNGRSIVKRWSDVQHTDPEFMSPSHITCPPTHPTRDVQVGHDKSWSADGSAGTNRLWAELRCCPP